MTLGEEWLLYWNKVRKYYEDLSKGKCEIKPRHWVLLYDSILDKFMKSQKGVTLHDLYTLKISSGFIAFTMKGNMNVSNDN